MKKKFSSSNIGNILQWQGSCATKEFQSMFKTAARRITENFQFFFFVHLTSYNSLPLFTGLKAHWLWNSFVFLHGGWAQKLSRFLSSTVPDFFLSITLFLFQNNPESVTGHGKYTLSKTFLLARCNLQDQHKSSEKHLLKIKQTDHHATVLTPTKATASS